MIAIRISRDFRRIPPAPSSAWFASGWPSPDTSSPVYGLISERLPFVLQVLAFGIFAGSFIWPHVRPRPRASRPGHCDAICRLCSAGTFRKNTAHRARRRQQQILTFGVHILTHRKITFSRILNFDILILPMIRLMVRVIVLFYRSLWGCV